MSITVPNYRYLLKFARKIFFDAYEWYRIDPSKERFQEFVDAWINLQYSKLQEKGG